MLKIYYILPILFAFAVSYIFNTQNINLLKASRDNTADYTAKPAATVEMTNTLNFTPDTVTISKGETVLWKNNSLLVHTVTGDPTEETKEISALLPEGAQPFNSGNLDPDDTYSHTFKISGTYNYFCIPHEAAMRGVVIVEK